MAPPRRPEDSSPPATAPEQASLDADAAGCSVAEASTPDGASAKGTADEVVQPSSGVSEGRSGPAALLEACPDALLLPALPALLGALPEDARERCLLCLREALAEELDGGVLDGDDAGLAAWEAALREQPRPAPGAAKPAKPRFNPMAAPFSAVMLQAARPLAEEAPAADPAAGAQEGEPAGPAAAAEGEAAGEAAAPEATSVYVANVPYDADEGEIKKFFEDRCRPCQVNDVRLLRRRDGQAKGAAILTFETAAGKSQALLLDGQPGLQYRKLIVKDDQRPLSKGAGKRQHEGKGSAFREHRDDGDKSSREPRAGGGKGAGSKGSAAAKTEGNDRSVIVKNLAFTATEANLGELFAGCGEVAAARLARDSRSGRLKGFAVVEFARREDVQSALQRSGRVVRGRPVRIEAMAPASASGASGGDGAAPDPAAPGQEKEERDEEKEGATTGEPAAPAGGAAAGSSAPATSAAGSSKEDSPSRNGPGGGGALGVGSGGALAGGADMLAAIGQALADARGTDSGNAFQSQAQALLGQSKAPAEAEAEPPKKRQRGESKPAPAEGAQEAFPGGEEGLAAAAALAGAHGSAEGLLGALGADALKGRLAALGLKAGGSPLERAQRLVQLREVKSLDEIPRDLLAKKAQTKAGGRNITISNEPVKFVRAGADDDAPAKST